MWSYIQKTPTLRLCFTTSSSSNRRANRNKLQGQGNQEDEEKDGWKIMSAGAWKALGQHPTTEVNEEGLSVVHVAVEKGRHGTSRRWCTLHWSELCVTKRLDLNVNLDWNLLTSGIHVICLFCQSSTWSRKKIVHDEKKRFIILDKPQLGGFGRVYTPTLDKIKPQTNRDSSFLITES